MADEQATPMTYAEWFELDDFCASTDYSMGESAWNARQPEIDALTAERDDLKLCGVVTGGFYDHDTGQTEDDTCENARPCAEHPPEAWLTERNRADGAEEALAELREHLKRAERGRDVAIANRDALGKSWHEIAQAIGGIPLHECPKDTDPCPECQKTLADLVTEAITARDLTILNARGIVKQMQSRETPAEMLDSLLAQLRTVIG